MGDEAVEVARWAETARLVLRPWRVGDAVVRRQLWLERDPRVPPHRRVDADGRPTVGDLEDVIRAGGPPGSCLLALERKAEGDVIGGCGLVPGRQALEPELAFELLRRAQGRGYATEAARAVLEQARSAGHRRLWATVWAWNTPSLRVLARLGFVPADRDEADPVEVDAARVPQLLLTVRL